jgi:hypothetical protein
MSVSKSKAKKIGFSTGALEKGDFKSALRWLHKKDVQSVELSALRLEELEPLVNALGSLSIEKFHYVSFHAPSSFPKEAERQVVHLLGMVVNRGWNIIVHPDVIRKPSLWKKFGSQLLIENMDRRKSTGRTASELEKIFKVLPNARLCLDMAHARQLDTTLTLLSQIIFQFSSRVAQIHISELDSWCQHQPMSYGAVLDYQKVAKHFSFSIPVIIESMLDNNQARQSNPHLRMDEYYLAYLAMFPNSWKTDLLDSSFKRKREENIFASFERHRKGTGKGKLRDSLSSCDFE